MVKKKKKSAKHQTFLDETRAFKNSYIRFILFFLKKGVESRPSVSNFYAKEDVMRGLDERTVAIFRFP